MAKKRKAGGATDAQLNSIRKKIAAVKKKAAAKRAAKKRKATFEKLKRHYAALIKRK